MRKLTGLFVLLLSATACFATGINFVENMSWAQIKAKAKKENKMIFFDAYATWCGPCQYLEESVYTDEAVAEYFNKHYINVKFDMETGEGIELGETFEISSYPTLMFFSPAGKLVHKYIGAMDALDFINLGQSARDPAKQYFTLREKAIAKQLTDMEFEKWAEMADDMEDDELEEIITSWLATKKNVLENIHTASVALFHLKNPDDKILSQLYRDREIMAKFTGWNDVKVKNGLYNQLFRRAFRSYERNNNNADSFRFQFRKFDPARMPYAEKDLNFRLAISGDPVKATSLLIEYMNQPVDLEDLAGWLLDYNGHLEEENFTTLLAELKKFSFRPADKDKEYWIHLMQLLCEMKLGKSDDAMITAEKALKHPGLPEEYRKVLQEMKSGK